MYLGIERLSLHENRPYRYRVYDETGRLLWIGDREEPWRIYHTRRIHFRTPTGEPVARLEPPPDLPWVESTTYQLLRPSADPPSWVPLATIVQRYTFLDDLLLHLPGYRLEFGGHTYIAQGSRYGSHLYEILEDEPSAGGMTGLSEQPGTSVPQMRLRRILRAAAVVSAALVERAYQERLPPGEVTHPIQGFSYRVELRSWGLRRHPLLIAALVSLVDMEMAESPQFRP